MKILLNYDYQYYPFTTASYLEMAFKRRADCEVYRRGDDLPKDLDLVFNVEPVGEFVKIAGVPTAYYEIDNHIIRGRETHFYNQADYLYLAQWFFKDYYSGYKIYDLPLAADPTVHKQFPAVEEIFDVGILGNTTYPKRRKLIEKMKQRYRVLTGMAAPGIPYSKKLSQCKMLFNCSMDNDINMRVFESIAIGKLFITDRIPLQDRFIVEDVHYVAYSDSDELLRKLHYYLNRSCFRASIARAGATHIHENHSYDVRIDGIIRGQLWKTFKH